MIRWTSAWRRTARTGTTGPRSISRSEFYDVDGWLRDERGPRPREVEALGDVTGLRLLHLQCHFGLDTLHVGARRRAASPVSTSHRRRSTRRAISRAGPVWRTAPSSCAPTCTTRPSALDARDVRHRLREPRRAVLAPERRSLGGAGRRARRARRALLHPRRAIRWRGHWPTTASTVRAHVLRGGRSVRRRLRRDLHRRRRDRSCTRGRTNGTTALGEIVTALIGARPAPRIGWWSTTGPSWPRFPWLTRRRRRQLGARRRERRASPLTFTLLATSPRLITRGARRGRRCRPSR